jgi:gliding motility-associated-like protein
VNISICGSDAPFSLLDELGGNPDAGGTWTGPGGGAHGVIYNPVFDGSGVYTYTVPGAAPCVSTSASVFVQEIVPVSAGANTSLTVCESDPPVIMADELGGSPNAGGSWSNPGGSPFGGVFNPSTDAAGNYEYTVSGIAPCGDSTATLSITVLPTPLSGGAGSLTSCADVAQIDLFNVLTGNYDVGGSWSDDSGTGQLSGSILNPNGLTPGNYDFTYTVNGNGSCSDQSTTVTITIVSALNAGQNSATSICGAEVNYVLLDDLNGNPQTGGVWSDDDNSNALVNGTLNASLLTAGTYNFTYVLAGSLGCSSDSAWLTVNIVEEPNAGVNDTYTVCSSSSGFVMTSELAGSPDPGGLWSDVNGPHSNVYNPLVDDSGIYTYTVSGTGPCPDATAELTVAEISAPDAGSNNAITICSSDGAFNMLDSLLGTPQPVGIWTDPSSNVHSGTFFPGSDPDGPYIFTVSGTTPCGDDLAVLNIDVNTPPNAGSPTSVTLCSNDNQVLLLSYLTGADPSGTWTDDQGAPFSGFFTPGTDAPGTYTYTVEGDDPCSSGSATVTVFINNEANAGNPTGITVCSNSGSINLFQQLGGSPQNNGTWTGPNGPHSGLFQSNSDPAGVYTYTVPGISPCSSDSATVTVTLEPQPDPGVGSITLICSDTNAFAIFDLLGGTPDIGGAWSGPNGPSNGVFIPSGPNATSPGIYTYEVQGTGLCANATASVTIVVNQAADAGNGNIIDVCDAGGSVNLFAALSGSPDLGGVWKDPNGAPHSGTFIPSSQVGGDYVYTVSASSPCRSDSAIVTVNLDLSPNAGLSGVHTTCDDASAFSLVSLLNGNPDLNGFWTDPMNNVSNGIFIPGSSPTGAYTYTVLGGNACADDISNLTIIENNAPFAGNNTTEILCSTVGTISLIDYVDGSPNAGGDWYDPDGLPMNGLFIPGTSDNGDYTYVVGASAPCVADTAVLDLTVTIAPDAGINTAVLFCDTDPSGLLTDLLLGTPDSIGNWFGPDSLLHGPFLDPAVDPSGTYTYYVVGGLPCQDETSTVQVSIIEAPFAGDSVALTTCVSDPAFNLANGLVGADPGGTWVDVAGSGALAGSVVNATALNPGVYEYNYVVQGSAPCGNDTAVVTLEITSALYAGVDSFIVSCQGDPVINLFTLLGNGAQPGGVWTDTDLSGYIGVSAGLFAPSSVAPNTIWSFTYALPGVATCIGDTAVAVVQVIEGPYAGENGSINVCESAAPFSLLSVITNEDPGGDWFNSSGLLLSTDTLYPAVDTSDVFLYVVEGVGSCPPDTSLATVSISQAPNAGNTFTSIQVCTSDFPFVMLDSVGGNPDLNGGWAIQGCTVPVGSTFSPALSPPGQYCYIVPGIGTCPPTQSILDISVAVAPDAGCDGQVSVCSIDATVNLFFELTCSPDFGGSWLAPDLSPHSGILDPSVDSSGFYGYFIPGAGGCENDTAFVDVQIFRAPNAGISATLDTCALIPSLNLFDALGGDPDTTGIWIPQNGGVVVGDSLIVSGLAIGIYDFIYLVSGTGSCADSLATVTVDFTTGGANAGGDGDIALCSNQDSLNLNTILIGPADAGGVWDLTTGNPGFLQDSMLCVSCLPVDSLFTVYYVVVEPGCGADTAFINLEVSQGPSVGSSVTVDVCVDDPTFNIFDQLGGNPDTTGFWVGPLGNFVSPVFEPGLSKEGPYYYIIAPAPPCAVDTAIVFVEEWEYPDAGFDADLSGCAVNTTIDLFNFLGTSDTTGIWYDLDNTGNLNGSVFSFDSIAAGAYDMQYVVSNPGCGNDTADVTVTVVEGISIENFVFDCDMDAWSYSANFDIVGGDPNSYVVSGDMGELIPGIPYSYYTETYLLYDSLTLTISDAFGCGNFSLDTVSACDFGELVFVPESFSPNNDGINDYLEILGIEGFPNNVIHIYNRWGDLIYNQSGYDNRAVRWDGSSVNAIMGSEAPAGTYYYVLDLGVSGADVIKGYVYLNK